MKHFADLRDPRVKRTQEHLLEEILLMTIAAILGGCNGWNEIEDYAHSKHAWFKGFLTLPSGIPSHDAFNRVFSALDPEELEKGFVAWVSSIAKLAAGKVVAIDGKTLRGTQELSKKGPDKKAIVHMVSAWANTNSLVLGQRRVDEKPNEINAIPKLLDALELSGAVVTIDAMGCQRAIAEKIVDKKADYILAVKENQGHLLEEIKDSFQMLAADAARLNRCIRQHWGIENKLHWVLDVGFGEDLDPKRAGYAAQNFSVLNRIALNLLKQDKTSKRSIHGKRLKAGWDNDYLLPLPGN